jgi:hypothetical protein
MDRPERFVSSQSTCGRQKCPSPAVAAIDGVSSPIGGQLIKKLHKAYQSTDMFHNIRSAKFKSAPGFRVPGPSPARS